MEVGNLLISFEQKIDHAIKHLGAEIKDSDYDIDDEYLDSDTGYVYIKNKLYKIEANENEPEYIAEAFKIREGNYNFVVCYYNGGCSFNEVLEEAINKIKESK